MYMDKIQKFHIRITHHPSEARLLFLNSILFSDLILQDIFIQDIQHLSRPQGVMAAYPEYPIHNLCNLLVVQHWKIQDGPGYYSTICLFRHLTQLCDQAALYFIHILPILSI